MKKEAPWFTFTNEQTSALMPLIQGWFERELDITMTSLQARLLLSFITKEIGAIYYDKGITDAIAKLTGDVDDLYALMKS